jgi:ABC-type transport system involved in multi-copper enzyme maturation permease subunit
MNLAGIITIAQLTWLEARRRRIVLAAVLCGVVFLLAFGAAAYFMPPRSVIGSNALIARIQLQTMTLAGLYVVNFLVMVFAVVVPVDTLSGEISSGVIQTLASKPVGRLEILLGKGLVYWLMLAGYLLFMVMGIVGIMWFFTGFLQHQLLPALGLMQLEASVLLAITLAGGVHFSTVTNGIVAFGFYVIAVIGGMIEQIGVMVGNVPARYIGTAISLLSPSDAIQRLAVHTLQPAVMSEVQISPFGGGSTPSMTMVWWAVGYVVVALAIANRGFKTRAL